MGTTTISGTSALGGAIALGAGEASERAARSPLLAESPRQVPGSALLISLFCLAVAGAGNLLWPERLPQAFALLWLLALIPPFLLAYYRGWEGAALALVAGMVLLIGVEVGGSFLDDRQVRWWVVGGVIVVLVTVSLGVAMISEGLHRRESAALNMAYSDHLTGMPNRRILETILVQAFAAARRGADLAVALFDVDGFKLYNDRAGHATGDDALRVVASVLSANTRASDMSGRLGGDEFLTVLPGADAGIALTYAERIRSLLQDAAAARGKPITVSVGIAGHSPAMSEVRDLVDAADRALYHAKALGGNRAVVYREHPMDTPADGARDPGEPGIEGVSQERYGGRK